MEPTQGAISLEERLVLRRPEEIPLQVPGMEPWPSWAWWLVGGLLFGVALWWFFRVWRREAQFIGRGKASLLALPRLAVYALLLMAFLLPAWQETIVRKEVEEKTGRVLVLVDASGSMTGVSDDPVRAVAGAAPKQPVRRQDLVAALLKDPARLLQPLLTKNPVHLFRFGRFLDEEGLVLEGDGTRTRSELEADERAYKKSVQEWVRNEEARLLDTREQAEPARKPARVTTGPIRSRAPLLDVWLRPGTKTSDVPAARGLPTGEAGWLEALVAKTGAKVTGGEFNGTNVADSALRLLESDKDPLVQGLVIITDGRSTEGEPASLDRLREVAASRSVPVVVIGVGRESTAKRTRTDIVDLRVPSTVEPDDRFRVAFEAIGEGRAGEALVAGEAELALSRIRRLPDGKEEELDIEIVEPLPPIEKGVPRQETDTENRKRIALGKRITLPLSGDMPRFDASSPPRLEASFVVDANALAALVGRDKELGNKRWEIAETGDSELRISGRLKRPANEAGDALISRGPARLAVSRRPLRVLMVAGAAGREYQFVRTLMVREMEKKRARVSIWLQLPPGATTKRPNIVQDVPADRMLEAFPARFTPGAGEDKDDPTDLASFDLVILFDPDWSQIDPVQCRNLRTWVDNGGGLINVAGPVNMLQLARPGAEQDRFAPVLDLLPVRPRDSRLDAGERPPDKPWPLAFDAASPELDFLRLTDQPERSVEEDWADFFAASDPNGFFNYYPVSEEKKGAMVVARFGDPRAALRTGEKHPWLVVTAPASGRRVVWLGSDETWRLRMKREAFHERFWTKLTRWAASGGKTRVIPYPRNPYRSDRPVELEVKIEDRSGQPLAAPANAREGPRLVLTPPAGVPAGAFPGVTNLEPIPGRKGLFRCVMKITQPGAYEAIVEVPSTRDKSMGVYLVVETPPDPEQRDVSPDRAAWRKLASPVSTLQGRIPDADREAVALSVVRVSGTAPAVGQPAPAAQDSEPRLVFELAQADKVPLCFASARQEEEKTLPGKTRITDIWDRGWTLSRGTWFSSQPLTIPYLLVAIAALLGLEWSLRKAFRLA